jgi:hypothetical protein
VRAVTLIAVACGCVLAAVGSSTAARPTVYRIDHVADGDTVTLRNGQRVRLVQSTVWAARFSRSFSPALREAAARTRLDPGRNNPVSE